MPVVPIVIKAMPVEQYPLVRKFYKACRYPAKPGRDEYVYVAQRKVLNAATSQYDMVAALRLVPRPLEKGQQWYCLRSVVTAPSVRRCGIALALLEYVFTSALSAPVYCFALTGTEALYARVGFVQIAGDEGPQFMQAGYQRYCRQGRKISIMVRNSNEVVDV